jgi:hypothetical protein
MTSPPDFTMIRLLPAVVIAAVALVVLVRGAVLAVTYLRADRRLRPVLRRAWWIKWTWRRTARRVGLVQTERSGPPWWSSRPPGTVITRELMPSVRAVAEWWGVRIDVSTLGRLGVDELTAAARAGRLCRRCGGTGRRPGVDLDRLGGHTRRLIDTCWWLGGQPELAGLRLRRHAHLLGFRGHFATKSRSYSTTFTALRAERQHWAHVQAALHTGVDPAQVAVVGDWRPTGGGAR